jgi:lambda repressor-like predicted transcriptional regulator
MHPADIKASLQKRGRPSTSIARDLDVNRATVSRVISGKATSKRIANEVARTLGKRAADLWPGRYKRQRKVA